MRRNGVRLQLIQQPLVTAIALQHGSGVSIFTSGVTWGMWSSVLSGAWLCTASLFAVVLQFSRT